MSQEQPTSPLTERQTVALTMLAQGTTVDEIAHQMGIASRTARSHLTKAAHRLGANSVAQAIAIAVDAGLISAVEPLPKDPPPARSLGD